MKLNLMEYILDKLIEIVCATVAYDLIDLYDNIPRCHEFMHLRFFLGGQVWVSWGAMSISLSLFIFENPIPCYYAVIDNII